MREKRETGELGEGGECGEGLKLCMKELELRGNQKGEPISRVDRVLFN